MKKIKIWVIVAAVAATVLMGVAVSTLLRPATPIFGAFLVMLVLIAALAVLAFGRKAPSDKEELESLRDTVKTLSRELSEKSLSKLNVVSLNPILHVATMDVETSFVRPYVREESEMTFHGALRAQICAEYGVKLEDVLFRYDPATNTLSLANFRPGIIAFSKKQLNWDFAQAYRARKFLGFERSSVCDEQTDAYAKHLCETLRADLEKEIDERQVEELAWLSPLVSGQVMDVLRAMIGREHLNINVLPSSSVASELEGGTGSALPLNERERLLADGFVPLQVLSEQLRSEPQPLLGE